MCNRDKLMKLCDTKIENMHFVNSDHWFDFSQKIEELVDYLISNGVTVTNVGCKSEWISVEEKLPEPQKLVLCIWERGDDGWNYGFARYQREDVWYVSNEGMPRVTHWMPLPEPPTEKEN